MDPKRFYGTNKYVRDIPSDNESDDPDLSEDEHDSGYPGCNILAPPSDEDDEVENLDLEEDIIPETDIESDDDDEDIPLSELAEKLNPGAWRSGNLTKDPNEIKFLGNQDMPQEIKDLDTPYQFFKFFFTKEIISDITAQTNLYCAQQRVNRPANISENEIEQFMGMCLYMSVIHLPQARHYWSPHLGHPAVSSVMTCNR